MSTDRQAPCEMCGTPCVYLKGGEVVPVADEVRPPPPPSRGELINRRASLGALTVQMKEELGRLSKLSRKTPPKSLVAECARVLDAGIRLPAHIVRTCQVELEWQSLREAGY